MRFVNCSWLLIFERGGEKNRKMLRLGMTTQLCITLLIRSAHFFSLFYFQRIYVARRACVRRYSRNDNISPLCPGSCVFLLLFIHSKNGFAIYIYKYIRLENNPRYKETDEKYTCVYIRHAYASYNDNDFVKIIIKIRRRRRRKKKPFIFFFFLYVSSSFGENKSMAAADL